jgi:hypothetical protein
MVRYPLLGLPRRGSQGESRKRASRRDLQDGLTPAVDSIGESHDQGC